MYLRHDLLYQDWAGADRTHNSVYIVLHITSLVYFCKYVHSYKKRHNDCDSGQWSSHQGGCAKKIKLKLSRKALKYLGMSCR